MTCCPGKETPSDQLTNDASKIRRCLRCRATFNSEWAGERVCSHCKSSTTWRNGTPLRSFASGGRR
jgi:uncharacterized paraquat-inducible protein A